MQYQTFDGRLARILAYNAVYDRKQDAEDKGHKNNKNDRYCNNSFDLIPFNSFLPVSLFLFIFIDLSLTHDHIAFLCVLFAAGFLQPVNSLLKMGIPESPFMKTGIFLKRKSYASLFKLRGAVFICLIYIILRSADHIYFRKV